VANNQVSHNTKIKSGEERRQSNPPTSLPKYRATATSGVMEKRRRNGIHLPQKNIIQFRILW
jgi:hypothetical protein